MAHKAAPTVFDVRPQVQPAVVLVAVYQHRTRSPFLSVVSSDQARQERLGADRAG